MLSNMMMSALMGGGAAAAKGKGKATVTNGAGGGVAKKPASGFQLYPSDLTSTLKWGLTGLAAFSAYHLGMTMSKRRIDATSGFKDVVEAVQLDDDICRAFMNLQAYRELNPWLFRTALQNVDQLLFLENALLSGAAIAVKKDKVLAWSYFRVGLNRLAQFQYLIRQRLGTDHAMTAYMCVNVIYKQMQKHLLNVFHLCSRFQPEDLVASAPREIERVLQMLREGREPRNIGERWGEVCKKLERAKDDLEAYADDDDEEEQEEEIHHRSPRKPRESSRKSRTSRTSRRSSHRTKHAQ
jgi:hypothetical protein